MVVNIYDRFRAILEVTIVNGHKVEYEDLVDFIRLVVTFVCEEECIVYTDIKDDRSKCIEVHFTDYNYYEIDVTKEDTLINILDNLWGNLFMERMGDLRLKEG